jgi:hypothetical protein
MKMRASKIRTALRWSIALMGSVVALTMSLNAHHGTAVSYDQSKAFSVKATVTDFKYANPHPSIYFDVKDEKGNVVHWSGEIAPNAAQLQQEGWGKKRSEAALAAGTEVTITIAPSRAGTPVGLINKIVGPTGESILGLTPLGAPAAGAEIKQ